MIKRDLYLKKLIRKKDNGKVKVITGIRRCGKSYLLFKIYKDYLISNGISEDQIITISLDGFGNMHLRNPYILNETIKANIKDKNKKYYLFIDEIQNVEPIQNPYLETKNIITFVDIVLGLMVHDNVDIYITGSNSKMLSTDILTQFRGRTDQIRLHPLSFSELYNHFGDRENLLKDYLKFGGMPEIYSILNNDEEKKEYLKALFNETYIKDVLERNNIKNDKYVLEKLLDFISSTIGSLINPSKLANRFISEEKIKIDSETISNYLEYFSDAFIISKANRYDIKGAKYFQTPYKFYYTDVGLRNARLNFAHEDKGHIMENVIYNDLIRRGYTVDVGVIPYNYRDNGKVIRKQLEVDFVVTGQNVKYYIQSTQTLYDEKLREREIKPLINIKDSFTKIVIVNEYTDSFYNKEGVFYISLKDFLLNEDLAEITKRK